VDHRYTVVLREPMHRGDVRLPQTPERRRGRGLEPPLPAQELTHPADGLQLRDIALQEDPIHRPAGERDVLTQ
jgi:hypothetical protein